MIATLLLLAGILIAGSRASGRLPRSSGPGSFALAWVTGAALFLLPLNLLAASVPLRAALAPALLLTLLLAEFLARLAPRAAALPPPPAKERRRASIALILVTSVTSFAALRGYFFDELDHHFALALEISRGLFPPPFPFLPDAPFRYHYGVDLMAAALEASGWLPIWYAFDVVTTLSAFALLALLIEIAWITREPGFAPWVGLLGTLGSGLAWARFPREAAASPDLGSALALPFYELDYTGWQIPPVISYLHQHPMAFGAPFYLALLYAYLRARRAAELPCLVLIVPYLAALSMSQVTLFYLTFPLILSAEILRCGLTRAGGGSRVEDDPAAPPCVPGRGRAIAAAMLSGALLASVSGLVGGGPTPSGDTVALALSIPPWHLPAHPFPGYLALFGIPVLAGILLIPRILSRRHFPLLVLGIGGFGGFLVPHLFIFRGSPYDTVKFFFPTVLAANVILAWVVAESLGAGRIRAALGLALAAASVPSALLFLFIRCLGPLNIAEGLRPIPAVLWPEPAGQPVIPLAKILRQESHPHDVVMTRSDLPSAHSGVPSFYPREPRHNFPDAWEILDPDHRFEREQERMFDTLDPDLLRKYRIRWLVIGPEDRLGEVARTSLDARPELLRLRHEGWELHDLAPMLSSHP